MTVPALVFPLHQLTSQDFPIVGKPVSDLYQLQKLQLPVVPTFAVPSSTLEIIAEKNQLSHKMATIFELIDVREPQALEVAARQLQQIVLQQQIPQPIIQELLHLYTHQFHQQTVKISVSPLIDLPHLPQPDYCRGEANMIQAILHQWSQFFSVENLSVLLHHPVPLQTIPAAIILQTLPEVESSGHLYTRNKERDQKHLMQIRSGWGLQPHQSSLSHLDNFIFDVRTREITQRERGQQTHHFLIKHHELEKHELPTTKRDTLSLADQAIQKLAELSLKAKHSRLDHLHIEWIMADQPYFTAVNTLDPFDNETTETTQPYSKGQPLVSGQTWGVLRTAPHASGPSIYYFPQLTHQHLSLLEQAVGLILQQPPTSAMIGILQKAHIPTILVKSKMNLTSGMQIKLDADQGLIHVVQTHQPEKASVPAQSPLEVWAITGNPAMAPLVTEQKNDGYFFQLEFLLQQLRLHPLQLIETGTYTHLSQLMAELCQLHLQAQRKPVLFQSLMSLDISWQQLKHAPDKKGDNDWLGERGASSYLQHPQLLQAELQAIDQLQKQWQVPMGWVSGWVRTSSEWHIMALQLQSFRQQNQSKLNWWLMIDTPALLHSLEEVSQVPPEGIIVNVQTLHQLMTGIDPTNTELLHQYALDQTWLKTALEHIKQIWPQTPPQVMLLLDRQPPDLVEQLQDSIDGVIVRPVQVATIQGQTR